MLSLLGSTFSSEERIECSFPFWRLLSSLALPGIAFLVTSLLAPIARVHLVRQEFLPLSLAAGVFARWHQELGHDSSEPVCLVVGRAVVRAKGHGGLAWQWLMCRPEWWWAVDWPGR